MREGYGSGGINVSGSNPEVISGKYRSLLSYSSAAEGANLLEKSPDIHGTPSF